MSLAKDLDQTDTLSQTVVFPPGDLWSDELPLETDLHLQQMMLLLNCLNWWWRDRNDFYVSGNLTIYYSPRQRKSEFFRGPDFFVVLGTERKPRKSWVVWQEGGKYPNLIIEILSESTATTDRELKKQIYQDTFRTPDYFWFDPYTQEFNGFHLVDGQYQPLVANLQGWLWSQQLELYLGVQDGSLRFFNTDRQLLLTGEEAAVLAQQQVEQEAQRAERFAAKLRELNVDPDIL